MKIRVTEDKKREIINFSLKPLYIRSQSLFCVYGNLKFKEKEKTNLFGKKVKKIFMTSCVMKLSSDVDNKIYQTTDEGVEELFNRYELKGLREDYLGITKRYKIFENFMDKHNKEIEAKKRGKKK